MTDVHCSGCGRRIAVTPNRHPGFIFDEEPGMGLFCQWLPPVGENEERDALILELVLVLKKSPGSVSNVMGISRQRVQQIVASKAAGAAP